MGVGVVIGILGAVAGAAGAANSAVQGQKAAKRARKAGKQQALALRAEAAAERERGRRLAGSQRAAFGAAGVTGAGSPLLVQADSLLQNIRVRERILAGARNVQSDANAQADAFRLQGISGAISGLGSVAGALSGIDFTSATSSASAGGNSGTLGSRNPAF